jgi:hypothetical protein
MREQAKKFSLIDNAVRSRLNNCLLLGLLKSANHITDFRKLLLDGGSVRFEIQQPPRPEKLVNFPNYTDVWPEVLH